MKLISLNIWGGRVYEPLLKFVREQCAEIDVFCFQEVYRTSAQRIATETARANIYQELADILPDFVGYYTPTEDNWAEEGPTDFPLEYGLAIFVKKSFTDTDFRDTFIHKHKGAPRSEIGFSAARAMQILQVAADGKTYTICNLHGLHNGKGKTDSDERVAQSEKITEALERISGAKILCGDFNLEPHTKSIAVIESAGMRNLIKDYGVTSTRSNLYKKEVRFADYTFISAEVELKTFTVLNTEVSDHLPMLIEFA